MSRLTDLITQAKAKDPRVGADLEREFKALSSRLSFGLNFERHRPEAVELSSRPIRRGDKVRVLPERGATNKGDQRLWLVQAIHRSGKKRMADIQLLDVEKRETQSVSLEELVVVAEFKDQIFPGLVSTGKVQCGGEKPFHTIINGENYHVLKALTYTHRGSIDVIYIDPPYNTGDKDWKYNNDYVEGDDLYRHSKWLAFMERRLLIARELLNPSDSVLIVTIDEKEYLRLGLLLEQVFPEARITMVTSSINNAGVSRRGTFGRAAEYIFVLQFGASEVRALQLSDEWNPVGRKSKHDILWNPLIRTGTDVLRADSPNLFYPIYIKETNGDAVFDSVGDPFFGADLSSVPQKRGCYAVWPIRRNGDEGRWQVSAEVLRGLIQQGFARLGKWRRDNTTIYYLKRGERQKLQDGSFKVSGTRADGSVITDIGSYMATFIPTDVWRITSHDAGHHGSNVVTSLIQRKFPFPKSLYAVEDALRFFVHKKPEATILDFFSGSGTTAHAVMRLNKQDNGRRQCICVTNNEVSADEQTTLREQGLRPGDTDWEKRGICDYITKPRVEAAITGKTPDGNPVQGNYEVGKTVERDKPRVFKQIGFADSNTFDSLSKKKQLVALVHDLPQTLVTEPCPFIVSKDHVASILFDTGCAEDWLEALDGQEHITDFYIVTPVKRTFDELKKRAGELLGPVIVTEEEKLPMSDGLEENAEFFTLTYETPVAVSYQTAFTHIAPLLWLRAGSVGRRIEKLPAAGYDVADAYGLLVELDEANDFLKAVRKTKSLRMVYIVTDDERRFQALARRLPEGVEAIRLYESYLTNFAFANGDDA